MLTGRVTQALLAAGVITTLGAGTAVAQVKPAATSRTSDRAARVAVATAPDRPAQLARPAALRPAVRVRAHHAVTVAAPVAPKRFAATQHAPTRPASPPRRILTTSGPFRVVEYTATSTSDGELVVLGEARNSTGTAFDHAAVRIDLYDAAGKLLNPPVEGELQQVAGNAIARGAVVPFRWSQAAPPTLDHVVVSVTGVDPLTHLATPPAITTSVTRWRADESGAGTLVDGVVRNNGSSAVAVTAQLAAYDDDGRLVGLVDVTLDDAEVLMVDPGSEVSFSVGLDVAPTTIARVDVSVASA